MRELVTHPAERARTIREHLRDIREEAETMRERLSLAWLESDRDAIERIVGHAVAALALLDQEERDQNQSARPYRGLVIPECGHRWRAPTSASPSWKETSGERHPPVFTDQVCALQQGHEGPHTTIPDPGVGAEHAPKEHP